MDSTRPIFVIDYVDRPFDAVCERLADWQDQCLFVGDDRPAVGRAGKVDRIADHVVRLAMLGDDGRQIGELRALAVSTGDNPLTEVLVFTRPLAESASSRSVALRWARSMLETAVRRLEATARDPLPSRAS
ncbi:MAG TPA: hypothetical protein VFV00_11895 [Acidimicrobiales bacterium]|nr:hypothetical protein [Acidimicrobiales bacterium]